VQIASFFGRSVPWFFWAAPILMLSAALMVLALWGGYIRKVLLPKHRGRRVEE
jgi:hypothetical protein